MKSLVGKRFGRLVVKRNDGPYKCGGFQWLCKCDCGKSHTVATANLRNGSTQSCGCLHRDNAWHTHGATRGGKWTPEFRVWMKMRERCLDTNNHYFHRYGGRGIKICRRWSKFENFLADMGRRPSGVSAGGRAVYSLERINNELGYSPSNCRWATQKEQCRNKSSNRLMTYNGQTRSTAEWADIVKIPAEILRTRLWRGWGDERALSTPLRKQP